jgi:hypothetical protein
VFFSLSIQLLFLVITHCCTISLVFVLHSDEYALSLSMPLHRRGDLLQQQRAQPTAGLPAQRPLKWSTSGCWPRARPQDCWTQPANRWPARSGRPGSGWRVVGRLDGRNVVKTTCCSVILVSGSWDRIVMDLSRLTFYPPVDEAQRAATSKT